MRKTNFDTTAYTNDQLIDMVKRNVLDGDYEGFVNIILNDDKTELLEVESNLGGGMNFRYCCHTRGDIKEFEYSVMDIESLKSIINAIQDHIDEME